MAERLCAKRSALGWVRRAEGWCSRAASGSGRACSMATDSPTQERTVLAPPTGSRAVASLPAWAPHGVGARRQTPTLLRPSRGACPGAPHRAVRPNRSRRQCVGAGCPLGGRPRSGPRQTRLGARWLPPPHCCGRPEWGLAHHVEMCLRRRFWNAPALQRCHQMYRPASLVVPPLAVPRTAHPVAAVRSMPGYRGSAAVRTGRFDQTVSCALVGRDRDRARDAGRSAAKSEASADGSRPALGLPRGSRGVEARPASEPRLRSRQQARGRRSR